MSETENGHLHLAWYGYEACRDPGCGREHADPADDMTCADPDCEGGCGAARHNTARRAHLPPHLRPHILRPDGAIGELLPPGRVPGQRPAEPGERCDQDRLYGPERYWTGSF
jgi:hypothetical protein